MEEELTRYRLPEAEMMFLTEFEHPSHGFLSGTMIGEGRGLDGRLLFRGWILAFAYHKKHPLHG
jgi:hypothetical protein